MNCFTREELIEVCRLVYDRYLTNAAGSNFSVRASTNTFYLTPTNNAKNNRLRMNANDLLLVDEMGRVLDGNGALSRSWPTHIKIYQAFPGISAVIHAHPKIATAFACRQEPMEPFLDAMQKYGPIPVLPRSLTVDGPEFGDAIVNIFRQTGDRFLKHGHAVLYPFHGILVAGPTLADAYDLLERIEFNASAIINYRLLEK